jgi:hypothetical protein
MLRGLLMRQGMFVSGIGVECPFLDICERASDIPTAKMKVRFAFY